MQEFGTRLGNSPADMDLAFAACHPDSDGETGALTRWGDLACYGQFGLIKLDQLVDLGGAEGASATQQIDGFEQGSLSAGVITNNIIEAGPWLQGNGLKIAEPDGIQLDQGHDSPGLQGGR